MNGWIDAAAGASGDMFLGALVDAGAPIATIQAAIDRLPVEPIRLEVSTTERHGLGATKVDVVAPHSHHHRHWADIRGMLEAARLDPEVARIALDTFARLARAEAAVHRTSVDDVHFHEVGALDAIADIVGTAAGLVALGVRELTASTVTLGSGMTRGEHGRIPVPAPAVLQLLAEAGAPTRSGPAPYEMCTPTGAALLAATTTGWGPMPELRVQTVGMGAGGRSLEEVPNLLRLVLGEPAAAGVATQIRLEANVDDLDPRVWPRVLELLHEAGAADAWLSPITMKKGRPAHTVHVLAPVGDVAGIQDVLFRHTSTIGLRQYTVDKVALEREQRSVTVDGHEIGVKIARHHGTIVNVSIEYDDVRTAADADGIPVKRVLTAATAAAHAAFPLQ